MDRQFSLENKHQLTVGTYAYTHVTRMGEPARLVSDNMKSAKPMLFALLRQDGQEFALLYHRNGTIAEAGDMHEYATDLFDYVPPLAAVEEPQKHIDILFSRRDDSLIFVEIEDGNGKTLSIGTWLKRGEYDILHIPLVEVLDDGK